MILEATKSSSATTTRAFKSTRPFGHNNGSKLFKVSHWLVSITWSCNGIVLKVFEPVATSEVPSTGPDAAYDAAYAMLQAGSVQALPAFEALALERPHDTLVAMQLERLRAGETNDLIKLDAK